MQLAGGIVKLGDIAGEVPLAELSGESVLEAIRHLLPSGAFDFGWTVYGAGKNSTEKLNRLAMTFKKALKAEGISSRWVTTKESDEITPAAVAKLGLATGRGLDLCLFVHQQNVLIGHTTQVQDADAWSLRDYGRPERDDENGMLPPKLARMMVNLAEIQKGQTVLDPFCGSGTILMEAALASEAGSIIGSDHQSKQIQDTIKNTDWLVEKNILSPEVSKRITTFTADARKVHTIISTQIDRVITEGYLGPPLRGSESLPALEKTAHEITKLWQETLREIAPLLATGGRVVGIWPSFQTTHGRARVELTDEQLRDLGLVLIDPLDGWDDSHGPLLYSRVGQKVMRRIVVLEKV
jgi:tRNA G10  N-methylase Trm11